MTTWILILSLYNQNSLMNHNSAYAYAYATSSIESITGFKTQSACMSAANAWLKQNTRFKHIKALCVPDK